VAGGAGFIGSQLVRTLLEQGARVAVYDNFATGSRRNLERVKNDVALVIGDVLDEWKLSAAFRTHKPTFVFDLVGDTYVPTAYDVPKRFFRVNVEGTINVLMACKHFDVSRVLYASSTEVYGESTGAPMTEEHPLAPLNTYAVSKLAADRLCFTFFHEHKIPVVVARIYNCYGPRATQPYVIPEIITQLDKGPVVSLGNFDARRDFTYVEDTARALVAVVASDIPDGEAVNVGSGVTFSVRELVDEVGRLMGHRECRLETDARRLRRFDIRNFQCDPSKLQNITGWRPEVDLAQGLAKTIEWFRTHGRRWSWEDWVDGTIVYDGST
jgi:nucleoside-diphosphate-sugar epimerase